MNIAPAPKPPSYWFRADPSELESHRKEIALRERLKKAYESLATKQPEKSA